MQLSEAIRLGAMTHPQGFNHYERGGRTCALGAAANAAGLTIGIAISGFGDRWPFIDVLDVLCPACTDALPLGCMITHLNDDHRWTREAIADWVATVEPARHEAVTDASSADAVREDVASSLVSIRA